VNSVSLSVAAAHQSHRLLSWLFNYLYADIHSYLRRQSVCFMRIIMYYVWNEKGLDLDLDIDLA